MHIPASRTHRKVCDSREKREKEKVIVIARQGTSRQEHRGKASSTSPSSISNWPLAASDSRRSGSEFELLDFERTERFQTTDEVFKIIGGRMSSQGLGRSPRFAEHEHVRARSALENVIRNTTGVRATGSHQCERIFQRYGILLVVGLKETIDANHKKQRN